MKKLYSHILFLAVFFSLPLTVQAQTVPETGTLGLRTSFSNQVTIEVPYMFNETLSIAPVVGFRSVEDASTNFIVGVRPRYYMQTAGSLLPFVSGNLLLNVNNNKVIDETFTDINLGAGYGGEYFISDAFSVSAEATLNLLVGDSQNTFTTGAMASVSVYF